MITGKSVSETCHAIDGLTDNQLAEALAVFFNTQHAVRRLIQTLTDNAGLKIQEVVLYLSYFICAAYKTEHPDKTITVKRDDIDAAFKQNEAWIDRFNAGTLDIETEPEPYLLLHISHELTEPFVDGTTLSIDERTNVLLVLKTIMSAFELAARR